MALLVVIAVASHIKAMKIASQTCPTYRHLHLVIAHRLGGTEAPENTLAALKHAKKSNYKAVEFDVKLTKDKKSVLFHDEEFGRTVQQPGKIGDYELSQLLTFDAGSWHSDKRFSTERIAQFSTVLSYCRSNSVWMNVEIKPELSTDAETGRIVAEQTQQAFAEELAAYRRARDTGDKALEWELLHNLPLLSSFSFDTLLSAKAAAPDLPRAFLIKDLGKTTDWRERLMELEAVAVHTDVQTLTQRNAKEIKSLGYALLCYTVNTQEDYKSLLEYDVDSICTDKLDMFKNLTSLDGLLEVPTTPLLLEKDPELGTTLLDLKDKPASVLSSLPLFHQSKSIPSNLESLASHGARSIHSEDYSSSVPHIMRSSSTPILAVEGC